MSSLNQKRRLGHLWKMLPHSHPRKIILLYHSLGKNPPTVETNRFFEQIAWLKEQASVVSLDELLNSSDNEDMQVAISFDDGYATLYDLVAPILAKHNTAATVYINTGWIGETVRKPSDATRGHYPNEQFLTWDEINYLSKSGWTIGSHGVEHLDLTKQNPVIISQELKNSKHEIESRLGLACRHFAYTWGKFTPALQNAVQHAGYVTAVSGLHGPVTSTSNLYALPRIDVRTEYELQDFINIIKGHWDYLGLKQRLMRNLA